MAINPGTDLSRVREVASLVDLVLVMTVNPGFGGQALIGPALKRVPELRPCFRGDGHRVGRGVNRDNIRGVVEAGANWIVAGSAVFGAADPGAEAALLQELMAGRAPCGRFSAAPDRCDTKCGLRGRVRFPTGGDSPRASRGRPGAIPGPTVKVWKREGRSGTVVSCLPLTPGHWLEGVFCCL